MQNKGFVKTFAVLLTLACAFYLSFSFVTRYHVGKAAEDPKGEAHYPHGSELRKRMKGKMHMPRSTIPQKFLQILCFACQLIYFYILFD